MRKLTKFHAFTFLVSWSNAQQVQKWQVKPHWRGQSDNIKQNTLQSHNGWEIDSAIQWNPLNTFSENNWNKVNTDSNNTLFPESYNKLNTVNTYGDIKWETVNKNSGKKWNVVNTSRDRK